MIDLYDQKMTPIRQRFHARVTQLYREGSGDVLFLFLINHCALGVGMTEKVSNWIRRAGTKCITAGYKELGRELIAHAKHEAGHEQFMINDTRELVQEWNKTHATKLDSHKILRRPYSPGVLAYQQLHENCINSDAPYGQMAIEYEIEKVSVDFGPALIRHCTEQLGTETLERMSFIAEHVALDVGHTAYNRKALSAFLEKYPETLNNLVKTGGLAMDTYADYLTDCMEMAKKDGAEILR